MRRLPLVLCLLLATPAFAGALGSLLKAASHADDVARVGAKAASHADDAARLGAKAGSHVDDGAHAAAAAELGAKEAEHGGADVLGTASDVAGLAPTDGASPSSPSSPATPLDLRAAEDAKHARRLTELDELQAIAGEVHSVGLLEQLVRIRNKELRRHVDRSIALGLAR